MPITVTMRLYAEPHASLDPGCGAVTPQMRKKEKGLEKIDD
jgi:hypothetical protein